jgi:hypothetical protein
MYPTLSKGYHIALQDLNIPVGEVVYSGQEAYQMRPDAHVTRLAAALEQGD